MRMMFVIASVIIASMWGGMAHSQNSPWGTAVVQVAGYVPQKVVYDVKLSTPEELDELLDRVSGLSIEYGTDPFDAAIVVVLQGPEMRFFDINKFDEYEDLMRRAQSLTVGGVIEMRMCQRAAGKLGLQPSDIHGFIDMVPMGDAEIIRLQQEEGYAYMK